MKVDLVHARQYTVHVVYAVYTVARTCQGEEELVLRHVVAGHLQVHH